MEVRKRLLAAYSTLIGLWSEGGGRELQRPEGVDMGPRRGPEQGCRAVGLQGTGAGTGAKGWAWGAPPSEGVRRSRRGAARMEGEGKQERSTTQGGQRQMQG